MNALRQALAGMAAAVLCGAAGAAPAAPATPPEAFYSFSDLVRLTTSMDGAAVAVDDTQSASAGATRAPDDGPLHLGQGEQGQGAQGQGEHGQALRVGAAHARVLQAGPEREARYEFSVTAQPQGWLLLLSGLAAAGWVARRRLRHPIHA